MEVIINFIIFIIILKGYLNANIPMRPLRVLSGFSKDKGDYYIKRSQINPPESLLKLVVFLTKGFSLD